MTDTPPKYSLPEPADEDEAPQLAPEAEQTSAAIAMGIDYTGSFTLKDAIASFNASRQDLTNDDGELIPAEAQHLSLGDGWLEKHAGKFEFRTPSFYDNLTIRVRIDELTRGLRVKVATAWLAEATAAIETLMVKQPEWFSLSGVMDPNVVFLIHHWYAVWSFRLHSKA